jgi:Glycosyltransferase family 87
LDLLGFAEHRQMKTRNQAADQLYGPPHAMQMKSPPHYVKSLAMAIPAVLIGLQLSGWIAFYFTPEMQARSDFSAYYRAGYLLRTGAINQLYQIQAGFKEFIHPAYEAFVFVPFSLFSMRIGYVLWLAACVGLIFGIYLAMRPQLAHLRALFPWLPIAAMLSFLPIPYTAMQGQDSLLLVLTLSLAFRSLSRNNAVDAGLLLGLSMFRFQFLLPIALMMIAWRQWRFLAGLCVTGTSVLGISLMGGWGLQVQYVSLLRAFANPTLQPALRMVNARGILTAIGLGSQHVVLAVSGALVIAISYLGRRAPNRDRLLLAISGSSLVSYHFLLHDLSVMIIPILICMDTALERERYRALLLLAAITACPVVIIVFWGPNALWTLSFMTVLLMAVLLEDTNRPRSLYAKKQSTAES